MGIAIDAALIVILIFFICQSAKRGFIRAVIDVAGYILAMCVAISVSGPVAEMAYDNLVKPAITDSVCQKIEEGTGDEARVVIENVFDSLPRSLIRAAENFGVTKDAAVEKYNSSIQNGAAEAAVAVTDQIAGPVIINIFRTFVMMIILLTLICIIRIISRALSSVISKIPLIGWANRALGALVGIFKGGLAVLLVSALLIIILPLTNNGSELISDSYILSYISGMNMIGF